MIQSLFTAELIHCTHSYGNSCHFNCQNSSHGIGGRKKNRVCSNGFEYEFDLLLWCQAEAPHWAWCCVSFCPPMSSPPMVVCQHRLLPSLVCMVDWSTVFCPSLSLWFSKRSPPAFQPEPGFTFSKYYHSSPGRGAAKGGSVSRGTTAGGH